MLFNLLAVASLGSLVAAQVGTEPVVNTPPALIVCTPASLTFSGGTAPYILDVIPGGQTSAAAIESFGSQSAAGAYVWTVNLAAGTAVTLRITDATGTVNYSEQRTILPGTSTACVGSEISTTAAGTAATTSPAGTTSAGPSTSAATSSRAPTTSAATTSRPTTTASGTTSAAPASTTAATGGAVAYSYNVVALLGAAVLAIAA